MPRKANAAAKLFLSSANELRAFKRERTQSARSEPRGILCHVERSETSLTIPLGLVSKNELRFFASLRMTY